MGRGTGYLFMAVLAAVAVAATVTVVRGQGWLRSEQEMKWLYEEWVVEYDKSYRGVAEKEERFEIFKENLLFIDEHNRPESNNTSTLGLNQFADLTDDEFRALYLSTPINVSAGPSLPVSSRYEPKVGQVLPRTVDWNAWGAVSPVKHQGQCESCRAFAAVATIEGLNMIVNGDMVTLSEQELVDCDQLNNGCQPGSIIFAYNYIIQNGGIDTDVNYPYTATKDTCKFDRVQVVSITSQELLPSNNEHALRKAVANQPVSVMVESHGKEFRFHRSGVFTGPCGVNVDHFVTAIGYGRDDLAGLDYWLIKNSWGTGWGEGGIGKVQRNVGGVGRCGILTQSVYPVMSSWVPPLATGDDDHTAAGISSA